MKHILAVLVSACLSLPVLAHAEALHAVSVLPPPWACVQLNVAPGVMYEHKEFAVPLYAEPSASSAVVGSASDTMIARWPQTPTGGFVQVIQSRDRLVWIDARYVRAWANPYAPSAKCQPAIMSNGTVGIK